MRFFRHLTLTFTLIPAFAAPVDYGLPAVERDIDIARGTAQPDRPPR